MKLTVMRSILGVLFLAMANPILAAETHLAPTVKLDQAIHFLAADGSDVLVRPGTYEVEAAEEWLRLVPGERRNALLLEAHQTQHDDLQTAFLNQPPSLFVLLVIG